MRQEQLCLSSSSSCVGATRAEPRLKTRLPQLLRGERNDKPKACNHRNRFMFNPRWVKCPLSTQCGRWSDRVSSTHCGDFGKSCAGLRKC